MNDLAIKVDGLGKKYRIGGQKASYRTIREALVNAATAPLRRAGEILRGQPPSANGHDEIWALKGVSFEVKRGEVVGIIGPNGAGKSTLLKILSRITKPTEGRARVYGRVGSLLEVGTGFHPELTGRENVYLSGAILGMKRAEIERKFDEIVGFAGVEKFADTPVKHFSSGMYLRLAFSVAAHLDPEILLVDEVLAVGDAAFQKKCLGKMGDVAKEGRTVLFVSHQMDMVASLCTRGLLLDKGNLKADAHSARVIERYKHLHSLAHTGNQTSVSLTEDETLPLQILQAEIKKENGDVNGTFDVFEPIVIEIQYVIRKPLAGANVQFEIIRNGTPIFWSFDTDVDPHLLGRREPGLYLSKVQLPCPLLKPGHYAVSMRPGIVNLQILQELNKVLSFDIELISKPSTFLSYAEKRPGVVAVPLKWNTTKVSDEA